jgi:hypothetical protein
MRFQGFRFNCCRDIISAAQVTDDVDKNLLPGASINYEKQFI